MKILRLPNEKYSLTSVEQPDVEVWPGLQKSDVHDDWWLLLEGVLHELLLDMLGSTSPMDESHEGRFGERSREGSYAGPIYCSCCC